MKEYTIAGWHANLFGFLFVVPVLLYSGIPYLFIWRDAGTYGWAGMFSVIHQNEAIIQQAIGARWWLLLLLLSGIVLHELIHGVFMAMFAPGRWKAVSFGFNFKALAPYAHCKEPLTPRAYRISLMMPAFLLGDISVLAAWISGNILFLFFGILFSWAAAGDLMILWLGRRIHTGLMQDHPDKIGFIHIDNDL